jgi:hypothetical protein
VEIAQDGREVFEAETIRQAVHAGEVGAIVMHEGAFDRAAVRPVIEDLLSDKERTKKSGALSCFLCSSPTVQTV